MSLERDTLYKALTRPPMLIGVPIYPLVIVGCVIFLIAMWFSLTILVLLLPAYLILRILTKIDEKMFQVIGVKRHLLTHKIKNKTFKKRINAFFFSSINYSRKRPSGKNNKGKITMLDNEKSIPISELIPYSTQLTDTIVIDKNGYLLSTWVVDGISFETREDEAIDYYKNSLNTLLISMGLENVSFYFHNIKDFTKYNLNPVFNNDFANEINEKYISSFKNHEFMSNKLFVTVVFKKNKTESLNRKFLKKDERISELERRIELFSDISGRVESALSKFSIYKLSCYFIDDIKYSQQLEFFNYLLSLQYQRIRVLDTPIYNYLGNNEVSLCSDGILKIITHSKIIYAKSIEIKDWSSYTTAGFLDELIRFPCRYIITQSFSVLPRNIGKKNIDRQIKQLTSTEDDAISQLNELDYAKEQLISGEIIMGEHHFSAFIFGDNENDVNKSVNDFITAINDLGFIVTTNWLSSDDAYFGQLPSNFKFRHKVSEITSKNFVGLNSLHNNPVGKQKNNCWGNAVTLLKTTANQPFYFNFHQTKIGRNDEGEMNLAHSLMIGKSGTGKTMTLSFLQNQLMQYTADSSFLANAKIRKFTSIYFDKDYGAEINIRALNGKYFSLKNGQRTGFNPFMIDDNPTNIAFLNELIEMLASMNGELLSVGERDQIKIAINAVMKEKKENRYKGMSLLLENIQSDMSNDNSLKRRLSIWAGDGAYSWVFDNDQDLLDFDSHSLYGFDGTEILDNKNIVAPITFYILFRIEQIADGRRLTVIMDEFWKWLSGGKFFQKFMYDGLKTFRKRNGFFVFATQSPDEIINSDIARAIIEQVETFIFLPNSKADLDEYTKHLQVSIKEYEIIKKLADDSRQFLIKKGNSNDGDSRGNTVVVKLDLSGLGKENLKILSASMENISIVHSLINEVGEDPKNWLPLFRKQYV